MGHAAMENRTGPVVGAAAVRASAFRPIDRAELRDTKQNQSGDRYLRSSEPHDARAVLDH
jgi:hypothetical protein